MKPYFSVIKLRLLYGLQYRGAAFAGVATQFFWGFMYIMIFEAFYSHTHTEPPMTLNELVAYVWLQQAFLTLMALWFSDNEIFDLITKGNIAYELCRPCELYGLWYAKLLAQRLAAALLRSFPILIIAFLLPQPYRMMLPPSLTTFLFFLIALVLGLLILVSISMFIYISVFITMSPTGSLLMLGVVGEFFAGLILPIPLMPSWMQVLASCLPFRWTMDFPFRVYSGQIPEDQAWIGLVVQLVWLVVLVILGRFCLRKALGKVVVQGG
ncbi:ABC-2 type transport system permease protein [Pullulanibacillus pueri]|uniref:ABC transporter permease n=1 Tax=Pullulanibacillus pueri TaxID=1437324 RepID=A0A8J3EMZ2_9BACL|nr:ABC transporter permease [Pullulanibacillus pueri]MBM7683602.1 ABC-2 type transport system permease protein [Pullulanibacillus pueri]GGH84554.1 ABC transporter permease [Pullulanibacillus pueri]